MSTGFESSRYRSFPRRSGSLPTAPAVGSPRVIPPRASPPPTTPGTSKNAQRAECFLFGFAAGCLASIAWYVICDYRDVHS